MDKKSAERLAKVHPVLSERVATLLSELAVLGQDVRVVQGLRTFAEQDALYNQPRDGKDNDGDGKIDNRGENVTGARGGQSNHNYGLAVDLCPFVNGKAAWNNANAFNIIGREAKKLRLEWGGDWKRVDMPHVQLKGMSIKECQMAFAIGKLPKVWARINEILAGKPPIVFVPKEDELLEFGDKGEAVKTLQQQLLALKLLRPHEVDGDFGKITKNAVIAFQRINNLTADGIVGDGTKAKLAEAVK